MLKCGIDPGILGAIAFLNESNNVIDIFDMPTMMMNKKKQQVNAAEVARILAKHNISIVYLELVSAMPGNGSVSMFNFGMSFGVVKGVCAALEIPLVLVSPSVWKKSAGLTGKEKDYARTLAIQLYPGLDLGLKKHIGRAEALLIARYGVKK